MRPAKVVSIVAGALLLLIGIAVILSGGFLLWAHTSERDSAGFYQSSSRVVSTDTYALTTPDLSVDLGGTVGSWIPTGATAAIRIQAASQGAAPLFIGIGPTDQVTQYLANVAHDEVTDFGPLSRQVKYRRVDGVAAPSMPGQQAFWVAKQEGTGSQTLEWQVQSGGWTMVIMNGDSAPQVTADVSLGGRFGALLPIAIGLIAIGLVGILVGVVLVILGVRPARQSQPPLPPENNPPLPPENPPLPPENPPVLQPQSDR